MISQWTLIQAVKNLLPSRNEQEVNTMQQLLQLPTKNKFDIKADFMETFFYYKNFIAFDHNKKELSHN